MRYYLPKPCLPIPNRIDHLTLSVSVEIVRKGVIKHLMKTPKRTNTTNDKQTQLPAFPFYNEEEILNIDAVIDIPPPRESGTIRVKLIYEEPSEPMPVEDPWEE